MRKRLFTFGCSYTQYHWPTWADIIGQDFEYFENWGAAGAGNQYIFHSIVECNIRNQFSAEDTIIVMWSSSDREDRYINNKWVLTGNIFFVDFYSKDFIKNYYDEKGSIVRDFSFITAINDLLKSTGATYKFSSMESLTVNAPTDIIELHSSVLSSMLPSVNETLYRDIEHQIDRAKEKQKQWYDQQCEQAYNQLKGVDWPAWNQGSSGTNLPRRIKKDIDTLYSRAKKNIKPALDLHPSPMEYLRYVSTVLPEFTVTTSTIDWINKHKINDTFNQHLPLNRL